MMYSCAPAGPIGSSFNTKSKVVRRKGKNKRIDIHCHYHNPDVDPLLKGFILA